MSDKVLRLPEFDNLTTDGRGDPLYIRWDSVGQMRIVRKSVDGVPIPVVSIQVEQGYDTVEVACTIESIVKAAGAEIVEP